MQVLLFLSLGPSSRGTLRSAVACCVLGWVANAGLLMGPVVAQPVSRVARSSTEASKNRPQWPDERRAGSLICHATFPLKRIAVALDDLALLQKDLSQQLKVPVTQEPAHAFIFHNRAFYRSYIERHFPNVPQRQALFIKDAGGPGMIFVYYHRDVETDLRHESTHALLHAVLPMVPLWLDEGLAEYFEAPRGRRARGSSHTRAVKWETRLGRIPDLRDLERLATMEAMNASDYRDAWAWVHFMLHGSDAAKDELQQFLGDIAARRPPGSLGDRLKRRIPDLESQFLTHFRGW